MFIESIEPTMAEAREQPRDPLARMMLLVFALGSIAAGYWAATADPAKLILPAPRPAGRVVTSPTVPPPPVEPLELQSLTPDQARAENAKVPFSTAPNPAARPFRIAGDASNRARAIDCLAAANIYEAGDDPDGQRPVSQVVINRVRHPAFPKTVCGVVFQGQERRTGCQFTFTCDGAMLRSPSPEAWERARAVARQALEGRVDRRVGHATHYHTDWVVPYWSSSLDKIIAVGTHLFFRWEGWWGTPGAFRGRHVGTEPVITALAPLSEAHRALNDPEALARTAVAAMGQSVLQNGDEFIVLLDRNALPDTYAVLATTLCGPRDYCKVMGWTDRTKAPPSFPVDPAKIAAMSFSYLRNRAANFDKPLWNCAEHMRPDQRQCMKIRVQLTVPPKAPAPPRVKPPILRPLNEAANSKPVIPAKAGISLRSDGGGKGDSGFRRNDAAASTPIAKAQPQ